MIHWRLLPVALMILVLGACGADEEADRADAGNDRAETAAEDTGRKGPFAENPSEPEDVAEGSSEDSRKLWALIQEEQSELTDEQQRTLQACAEIRMKDQDVSMEESVRQCREEMEETLQEEEEQEEEGGGEE